MDTTRKCCKDELPKGCLDCQKEDEFGDICHAYQAYQQGRIDERKKIMEIVDSGDDMAQAMYLLGQYIIGEEYRRLMRKNMNKTIYYYASRGSNKRLTALKK